MASETSVATMHIMMNVPIVLILLMMINQGKVNDQEIPLIGLSNINMTTGCNMIQQAKHG